MDTDSIIQALKQEKERIENALAALGHEGGNGRRSRKLLAGGGWAGSGRIEKLKRRMSAAARKRISEAAKARWAKAKKAGRNKL